MRRNHHAAQAEESKPAPATALVRHTRVFVGLQIAPAIAKQLVEIAFGLQGPSVRRLAPADLHLTLVPPWNEVSVADTIAKLAGIAAKCDGFLLRFQLWGTVRSRDDRACCGPSVRPAVKSLHYVPRSFKPSDKPPTIGRFCRM
jgi:hypothetical protein